MNVNFEGMDLSDVVESAVSQAITKQLRTQLPQVVNQMLTATPKGYGSETNMLQRVFRAAVEKQVEESIDEFVARERLNIQRLVQEALQKLMNVETVAESITEQIACVKVVVHPYRKPVTKKAPTPTADGDEEI